MTDPKILAARCYTPAGRVVAVYDKIFVRGLVLDCRIGLYEEEKLGAQRVRFNVEVDVCPPPHDIGDSFENVMDYATIVEIIKQVIARGHINLMETLVESIAADCLADRRAVKVRIVAEKLDRLEGATLGVEIERTRLASGGPNVFPLPRLAPSGSGDGN